MRDYEAEGRARFRAYVVGEYAPADMTDEEIDRRVQEAYDTTFLGAKFKWAAAVDIAVAEFKRQVRHIFLRKVS